MQKMPSGVQGEPLENLVIQYQRRLLTFATRLLGNAQDAEEVVNDVFLTASQQADLSREKALVSWLYTVTRNLCIDRLRKAKHDTIPLTSEIACPVTGPSVEEDAAEPSPMVLRVREAVSRLPSRYQGLFEMRFGCRLTEREIAQILGVREGTVGYMVFKLKELVRKELGDNGSVENRRLGSRSTSSSGGGVSWNAL